MTGKQTNVRSSLNRALRSTGYWILIALWAFMLLAILFPALKTIIGEQVIQLGILTGLLAFLYHFDTRITHSEELRSEIFLGRDKILDAVKSGFIMFGHIANLFEKAMPVSNHVGTIRIFALNSDKILSAFYESVREFRADKVILLLQSSKKSENNIVNWNNLVPDRIGELDPVGFNPMPSSYFIIFDDDCMILGGYYPDDNPSKAYYIQPFLIRHKDVVKSYIRLFRNAIDYYRKDSTLHQCLDAE